MIPHTILGLPDPDPLPAAPLTDPPTVATYLHAHTLFEGKLRRGETPPKGADRGPTRQSQGAPAMTLCEGSAQTQALSDQGQHLGLVQACQPGW